MLFAGQGPLGKITLRLFLSPDGRFLSPDLLDSLLDPEREKREIAQRTIGQLMEGEFASMGPADAPLSVVMFSDLECPFCKQLAENFKREPLLQDGSQIRFNF